MVSLQEKKFKVQHKRLLKVIKGYPNVKTNCVRASGESSIFISKELYSTHAPRTTALESIAVTI